MDWPTVFGGGLYRGYFSGLQTIGMLISDDLFASRFRFKAFRPVSLRVFSTGFWTKVTRPATSTSGAVIRSRFATGTSGVVAVGITTVMISLQYCNAYAL